MKMLKELKWEAILTGVLYILLGIVALLIPETMQKTLGYLIGIVLIVAGLISIICYLLRDARENYYHNEFVFGILGIVLGAVVLYKVEIVTLPDSLYSGEYWSCVADAANCRMPLT